MKRIKTAPFTRRSLLGMCAALPLRAARPLYTQLDVFRSGEDGYHTYRIKLMMAEQGIIAYGAPRPLAKPLNESQRVTFFLREVLSLTLWRLHIM